jgi:hypothetical protein
VDASITSALAALTGAAVGGLTSGISNWLNHRSQLRAQWMLHEKNRRPPSATLIRSSTTNPTFPGWSAFTQS